MSARLSHQGFAHLLELLRARGHELIGPTIQDGAIVYAPIGGVQDLPIGWTDEQAPGRYRLREREDRAHFGYVLGPQGPRRQLTPPVEPLVRIRLGPRAAAGAPRPALAVEGIEEDDTPLALIGLRACELAALDSHDQVWTGGPFVDPRYATRRARALIIAVDCLEPGELCFCVSTRTGPGVESGARFDLRLTELGESFLVEIGSERGRALVEALGEHAERATPELLEARNQGVLEAAIELRGRERQLDLRGLPELLFANLDHPRWDEVAARCLSCGNCTQVCPTCFCHRVEERAPLDAETSERVRYWDSCFTDEHSRIHGAQFRPQIRERYRQWATHKLGAWVSQFGSSGCVGCGRCIAWCPVGIDITEEIAAIRADPQPASQAPVELPPRKTHAAFAGDPMHPQLARVRSVREELHEVVTLAVEPIGVFGHQPGQFSMLGLPDIGEVPISISGREGSQVLHTIRAVGAASRALTQLRAGDKLTLRGPFGRPWPLDEAAGHNVVVIAGGLGLAPLRGALREFVARPDRYPSLRLLYGARAPSELLFAREVLSWDRSISFAPETAPEVERSGHVKVHVTVDSGTPGWTGHVGVVTKLMRRKPLSPHARYFVCGPEIMMRFVLRELAKIGVPRDQVWLSMERNMKCAVGMCGRCQYGPHFICKDGPVFRWDEIETLLGREGF